MFLEHGRLLQLCRVMSLKMGLELPGNSDYERLKMGKSHKITQLSRMMFDMAQHLSKMDLRQRNTMLVEVHGR